MHVIYQHDVCDMYVSNMYVWCIYAFMYVCNVMFVYMYVICNMMYACNMWYVCM